MNRLKLSLRIWITLVAGIMMLVLMLAIGHFSFAAMRPHLPQDVFQHARTGFITAALLGTGVVMLLLFLSLRLLTKPLAILAEHMENLPAKDPQDRYIRLTDNGDVGRLAIAFNTMIREMEQHCAAVQESEQRYRIVTESAADFTYWQRLDGSFEFISPACLDVTGFSREELMGDPELLLEMIYPADRPIASQLQITTDNDACCRSDEIEYRITAKDGSTRWLRHSFQPIFDNQGACLGRRGSSTDITERKQLADQVSHLILHDLLTGLPNRSLLADRLSLALARKNRNSSTTVVLFFGIDRFKLINDTMGHDVGDRILIMTAERLRKILHTGDTLCRFSGDVFALILPERESRHEAITMSYLILSGLSEPFRIGGQLVSLTGSIGIALAPQDGTDTDVLLKNAEAAMYEAKRSGKNCFRFYSREINAQAAELLKLDNSMPISLAQNDFFLQYQPQLDLKSNMVVALEALLRWRHPELGMIPPDRFIPLAEENGFITRLGAWVLRSACMQATAWQQEGMPPLRVAVNISSRQFNEPDFVDIVSTALKESGLSAELLELELTESLLISDEQLVLQKLKALKAMGIHLAIDDFGTGYSSLSYLKHFPLDRLKIDKSFVNDILNDPDDAAITEAIIAMAHTLKLKVIAEGVETREQLLFLEERGCDEMQGYYLSRPLSPGDLANFIKSRP